MRLIANVMIALSFIGLIGLLGIICGGCLPEREGCKTPGAMRCEDGVSQVCLSDGVWLPDDDCSEVTLLSGEKAVWTCCEFELDRAECSPDKECAE